MFSQITPKEKVGNMGTGMGGRGLHLAALPYFSEDKATVANMPMPNRQRTCSHPSPRDAGNRRVGIKCPNSDFDSQTDA